MENLDSSFDDPVRIQDRYSDGAPRKLRKSRAKGSRTCLDFEISHLEADYEIGMMIMQAQYVVADSFYDGLLQETYPDHFAGGFSRGSSFAYQDYRCLLDRGELTSRLCPTSLVDHTTTLDATGLGFAGNPPPGCAFGAPEDIPAYDPASWDWPTPSNGIVAPAPVYAAEATGYLGVSKPSGDHQFSEQPAERYHHPHHLPSAQLPTPAAMSILLNPHGRSDREHSQSGYPETHFESSPLVGRHVSAALRPFIRREGPIGTVQNQGTSEGLSREKKHACTMCYKRFDRPSTLKKHLLVHTGEKAFVCDTCGRRFGVASNLNRHVKRCILKPVNSNSPSHKSTTSSSPSSLSDSPDTFAMSSPNQTGAPLGKRSRTSSVTSPEVSPPISIAREANNTTATAPTTKSKPPGPKRRRRAPSPSQWVPDTLQSFNLLSEDSYRVPQVPLPPVRRNLPYEERDSWDENVNQTPYHPCGWRGVLPGPGMGHGLGLGGKDVRNLDLGVVKSPEGADPYSGKHRDILTADDGAMVEVRAPSLGMTDTTFGTRRSNDLFAEEKAINN